MRKFAGSGRHVWPSSWPPVADRDEGASQSSADWEVLGADEVAYDGFLRVVRRQLRLPRGPVATWELIDIPPTVTVLAFTPRTRW